jgi:hypothetical protein
LAQSAIAPALTVALHGVPVLLPSQLTEEAADVAVDPEDDDDDDDDGGDGDVVDDDECVDSVT